MGRVKAKVKVGRNPIGILIKTRKGTTSRVMSYPNQTSLRTELAEGKVIGKNDGGKAKEKGREIPPMIAIDRIIVMKIVKVKMVRGKGRV